MNERKQILDVFSDYEDRILVNRILDVAEYCSKKCVCKFTDFLDPRQQKLAESILKKVNNIKYEFNGVIKNAERQICIIKSYDYDDEIHIPIVVTKIEWETNKILSHRDFLGSIIGIGIKREKLGDIIVGESYAYIALHSDVWSYIEFNLHKIGSTPVSIVKTEEELVKIDNVKTINSTVASLRLDNIIACGFGFSRTKAAEYIKSGKVKLNWEEETSPSANVREGNVVSLKGRGRIVLEKVEGQTKKDRIKITISKLI